MHLLWYSAVSSQVMKSTEDQEETEPLQTPAHHGLHFRRLVVVTSAAYTSGLMWDVRLFLY